MTKHEYIEEYGRHDACFCENCEEYFHSSKAAAAIEPHGEETPLCPFCGSDYLHYPDEIEMTESEDEDEER